MSAVLLVFCFLIAAGQAYAQENQAGSQLQVLFAGDTAEPYTILADSANKYAISQSYSWVRDDSSRYSLVSYSIDDGAYKEIPRKSRGSFSLELSSDSARTVTFQSTVQFPISVVTDSEDYLEVFFSPPSPTADEWFDVESNIVINVSNKDDSPSAGVRKQIVSWSLDNAKRVAGGDNESSFTTFPIRVATYHDVKFISKTQYYVDVVTIYGTPIGKGWYDAGSKASVSVTHNDELLIPHTFDGWQDDSGLRSDDNPESFLVDSPRTLTANWTADYSRLAGIALVPIAAAGSFMLLKKRSEKAKGQTAEIAPIPPLHEIQQKIHALGSVLTIEQDREVLREEVITGTAEIATYSKELTGYAMQKSVETIAKMHSAGLISDAKFSKVKEKLQEVLE